MDNLRIRMLLFLIGCIGTRVGLTLLSKKININILPYLGYFAILPAVGVATIFIFKLRETGAEVFGEKIWWNNLRPLHALLYGVFSILAIRKNSNAWVPLAIDTIIGFLAFIAHHFLEKFIVG